ncbi:MAG: hypothetical protein JO086_02220 [Acidimicrobiia bacterium]|nr:hypothetical protein [Acidimicrobiia bacterium]
MERRAGRTRATLAGTVLVALGILTMVAGRVSPASADPGNGNAYGHTKHASVMTYPDPAPDQFATDTSAGDGATDCGAYCPSGVGLPSGNGNGNGDAHGKPCAGCVGNADDKNPPGQAHDGSDHNNGYECDGNNGIGKTNPAHSGCESTTTTGPQTTTTTALVPCTGDGCPTTTTTEPSTTTTLPAATTTMVCTGQDCSTTTTVGTNVLGEQFSRPSAGGGSAATGPLAFTGGVVGKLFLVGFALVLMGIVVMAHRARGVLANHD